MKKHIASLISGLVLCAASIGLFRTNTYQKVEAASESKKLSYDAIDFLELFGEVTLANTNMTQVQVIRY